MKAALWLVVGLVGGVGGTYVAQSVAPFRAEAPAEDEEAQMREAADRLAQRQPPDRPLDRQQPPRQDQDEEQLKSRFGRYLMDLFDRVEGGIEEDRRLIRETLRENDRILHENLGDNLRAKIEAANNTHTRGFSGQPRNFVERPDAQIRQRSGNPHGNEVPAGLSPEINPDDAI